MTTKAKYSSSNVHHDAVVSPGAVIAPGVSIGPFCRVDGEVRLDEGVVLGSHVVLTGRTTIGPGTYVHPFATIGGPPQDKKYAGEDSELIIGAGNIIREQVTVNTGTQRGGLITRIGDDNLIMAGAHVAHDCQIGNHTVIANNVALGGHVVVQDHGIIGGNSAVHQFVRIGTHSIVGGMTGVEYDVIPYGSAHGARAVLQGLNLIGLKRAGLPRGDISTLREAYALLFEEGGTLRDRAQEIALRFSDCSEVQTLCAFVCAESQRGLCLPRPVA